ncbi:MAG: hypothetical protein SVU32_05135 [Candidatus Nanohaloarchaea archaeon]|nr:hypothetical protein [Candidatus Nanohaloarchaea archaeon]
MRGNVQEFVQTYNTEKDELDGYKNDIVERYDGDIDALVTAGAAVEEEIEERFRDRAQQLEERDDIERDEGLEAVAAIFAYDIQDNLRRSIAETLPDEDIDDYLAALMEEDLSEGEDQLAEQYGSMTEAAQQFAGTHDTYVFKHAWRSYLQEEENEARTEDYDILRSFGIGQKYLDELDDE